MALDRRLESDRFPFLPLVIETLGRTLDVEALVDTGFDGDVALPTDLLVGSGMPNGYAHWILADGTQVLAPGFSATVELPGFDPFPIVVSAIGHRPVVGRGVTDRFTLILDHGQRIIVEP